MRVLRRLTLGAAAVALAFAIGSAGGSVRAAPQSTVVGHVYVNENTAGTNQIAGFDRHADGSLTPISGSPFAAGGAGTGSTTPSQGALQMSGDGRYLLAVDAGSNEISVLRIKPDGALTPVEDSPVSSGGKTPVSIAVHGNLVYVANTGASGSNYTGFTLNAGGHLRPITGSTYPLPDNALPGDVVFNSTGTLLAGTRVGPAAGPSFIDSFTVSNDGHLHAAAGSPFPAQGIGPFGSEFRPTNASQLFVSNAHNGPGAGTVSAFSVASDGALNSIGTSPFPDLQTAPCWVEISHDGQVLFTVNTAVPSMSSYSIAANGALTLVGAPTAFKSPSGLRPFDARLDPTGGFLYVVGASKVSAFAVNGSNLTELPGSPFSLPVGASAFGIVAN